MIRFEPTSCNAPPTPTNTPTHTPCPINFTDVHQSDYFFVPVQYMFCEGVISGYSDRTFRPYNDTTRAQLAKIVVLALRFPIDLRGSPHFADVPQGNVFYNFVETAFNRNLISGYNCGGRNEPCDAQNRPYFRPSDPVTRGQLSKIVVLAMQWSPEISAGAHFVDVPKGSVFYEAVETAVNRGIISGYNCGEKPSEPCDAQNRRYFRPNDHATRGQISKIVYQAINQP